MQESSVAGPGFSAASGTRSLRDYYLMLRRARSQLLVVVGSLVLLTIVVAFALPPVYRSAATILIEQQEVPPELVRSTISTYADQRLQIISQRVMTSANLIEIVRKYNLYPDKQAREPKEVIVRKLRDDIKLGMISADVMDPRFGRPTQATIAFSLSYESRSPELAQKVTNELTSLYLNENLKSRTESAQQTSTFLSDEGNKLSAQIAELEARLAVFKRRNANRLPELMPANMQIMDRTEADLREVERQIRSLEERAIYLESQLKQVSPNASLYTEGGERILAPEGRLKALQLQELGMAANYAPTHPDLMNVRKQIAALRQQLGIGEGTEAVAAKLDAARADLAEARKKYSDDHPDIKRFERTVSALEQGAVSGRAVPVAKPDNPAYIELQAQLQAVNADLRTQRERQSQLKRKLESYEGDLARTPQVESEYRALTRDYENAQHKYQDIRAKQMEAQLGQSLESERKGERFTLIEPPLLPETPFKPRRSVILFLGMALSFAGGIGGVMVADSVNTSVRSAKDVVSILRLPPLGTIPYIEIDADRARKARRIRRWKRAAIVAFGVLVGMALLYHLFVKPLDVLWFAALRRLGM